MSEGMRVEGYVGAGELGGDLRRVRIPWLRGVYLGSNMKCLRISWPMGVNWSEVEPMMDGCIDVKN
jgi:hypothetical protein